MSDTIYKNTLENTLISIEQALFIINILRNSNYFVGCTFRIEQSPYPDLYYVLLYDEHNVRIGRM